MGQALKKTSEITANAHLGALVDKLARMPRVESRAVGYGGSPSEVYAVFEEILASAGPEVLPILLSHESPTVRLYAARHIPKEIPAAVGGLEALLDDVAVVSVLDGCVGGAAPIATWVVHEFQDLASLPGAVSLFRAAVARPHLGAERLLALRLLGGAAPDEAAQLARNMALDPGEAGEVVAGALSVFWGLVSSEDARISLAQRLVMHHDAAVRGALPRLLVDVSAPSALSMLDALREDAHGGVRSSAEFYWASHPLADEHEADTLIRRKLSEGERSYLSLLVNSEKPAAHAQLVAFVRAHEEVPLTLSERAPSEPFARAALELSRFDAPGVYWGETPRSQALRYLARIRHPDALEACLLAYEGTQHQAVWQAAAEGVVALRSDGSEGSLLALLDSPLLLVRAVAMEKLGEVGSSQAVSALTELLPALSDPARSRERVAADIALQRLRERAVNAPEEPREGGLLAAWRGLISRISG